MEYKIYILVKNYHLSLSNITFISISNFSSFEKKNNNDNQYPCKSYLDKDSFLSHINLSRLHATISSVTMEIVMKAISRFASPWKVNWEKLNLTFLKTKFNEKSPNMCQIWQITTSKGGKTSRISMILLQFPI